MMTQCWRRRVFVGIALGLSVSGCGLHGRPKVKRLSRTETGPQSVQAPKDPIAANTNMSVEPVGGEVVAPGIVEPWDGLIELSAREPGWIAQILVGEGDIVREGQLLALLDADAQRGSVELAKAELAEAEARAGFARETAGRMSRLHKDGTIPDNEADRTAAEASAKSAAVEQAVARLRLAEASVERRRVVAPRSGTVLLSRHHPGEFYQPGAEPLFVLGDMTRLQVRLEVDEVDAADVSIGSPCALLSDGGAPLGRGTIVRVAPKMGRRGLPLESPTARVDVRVREVFVELPAAAALVPGQRVWGRTPRFNSGAQP